MATLTEQKEVTTTTQPKELAPEHEDEKRTHRYLVVAVAVLAVALVGLVAWVVYDNSTTPDTATTGEIDQLMDDYHAAWNDYDGDAFLALVTEDYTMRLPGGSSTDAETQAETIVNQSMIDWHVDQVGDPIMSGDGPWYVAQVNHLESMIYAPDGLEGTSVFVIVDDNGVLRVAQHDFFGNL